MSVRRVLYFVPNKTFCKTLTAVVKVEKLEVVFDGDPVNFCFGMFALNLCFGAPQKDVSSVIIVGKTNVDVAAWARVRMGV